MFGGADHPYHQVPFGQCSVAIAILLRIGKPLSRTLQEQILHIWFLLSKAEQGQHRWRKICRTSSGLRRGRPATIQRETAVLSRLSLSPTPGQGVARNAASSTDRRHCVQRQPPRVDFQR